jgi:hypothetical protein
MKVRNWVGQLGLTHYNVSMAKSALRVGAGIGLVFGSLIAAGVLLILAEVLGVVEEMV